MSKKWSIAVSIVCGCICAGAVVLYTSAVRAEAQAARTEALARYGGDQLEVCVATRDIAPGESISQANATTRQWLVDLLPTAPVESLSDVVGKTVSIPIVAGSVLSSRHFEGTSPSIVVPSGLQAVSVDVTTSQAVGGTLEAGAKVDVYAAGAQGAALIASDALVTSISSSAGSTSSVTLAIEPQVVEQVIAATQSSSVYLTLPSQQERSKDNA